MKTGGFPHLLAIVLAALCLATPGVSETRKPLTVFAAASLGEALQSALSEWPGDVRLSLGGSGAIARQIDHGAPADVVMLANPVWLEWLEARGHLVDGSRRAPLGNALVLVGPEGSEPLTSLSVKSILGRLGPTGRLAMGEHRSVPAGQYARAWLKAQELWDDLRPHLAEVENVRAAYALVARGEVPLALLYRSDLAASDGAITSVWDIPADEQPKITYALAATTPDGVALVDYLAGAEARVIFLRFGFTEPSP